jgi:hypothetical protein
MTSSKLVTETHRPGETIWSNVFPFHNPRKCMHSAVIAVLGMGLEAALGVRAQVFVAGRRLAVHADIINTEEELRAAPAALLCSRR